jgi:hypothetical protein
VLKPAVKAARVLWNRLTFFAEMPRQRDAFIAQLERRNAQPRAAQTQQSILFPAGGITNGNQFKRQRIGKEIQLATEIMHGQPNRTDFADDCQDRPRKRQKYCCECDTGENESLRGRTGPPPFGSGQAGRSRWVNGRNPIRPDKSSDPNLCESLSISHSRVWSRQDQIPYA